MSYREREWDEPGPDFGKVVYYPRPRRPLTREGQIRQAESRRKVAAEMAENAKNLD